MLPSLAWYSLAALCEIAGCFSFWAWLRNGKNGLWVIPGMASLALFAFALTRVESEMAGRAYAAYGGIYIVASILWLWLVEKSLPDRWDLLGGVACVLGTLLILGGPRSR
jgi:small multidrug resistance family-3 protein